MEEMRKLIEIPAEKMELIRQINSEAVQKARKIEVIKKKYEVLEKVPMNDWKKWMEQYKQVTKTKKDEITKNPNDEWIDQFDDFVHLYKKLSLEMEKIINADT